MMSNLETGFIIVKWLLLQTTDQLDPAHSLQPSNSRIAAILILACLGVSISMDSRRHRTMFGDFHIYILNVSAFIMGEKCLNFIKIFSQQATPLHDCHSK
jgi:hypothetical protein